MNRHLRSLSILLIAACSAGEAGAQQLVAKNGPFPQHKGDVITITPVPHDDRGTAPPNDDCTGAVNHALAVGQTLSLSGNNTGATDENGTGYVIVYEKFTITTCADITVNYCVAGSVFTNFLTNLTTSCPDILTGLIAASSNDNCSVTFLGMAAGTYYIPVLADGIDTPVGPYTIGVSASACDAYCAASATDATFEVINNVNFAGINNASASTAGYEDHTAIVGQVVAGSSYPLTVVNTNGYATDMLMAWIDFDHSQTFEANELVYTSAAGVGPYTGNIAIPGGAALGQTRMRFRLQDTAYVHNFTACGTHQYGQVQDYNVNITSGGNTPPNDHCTGAVNHALSVGQTLSLSGNNTGATDESSTGFPIVYEEFTLTTCASITVNYCVPGSVFTNFLTNLTTSCPDILTGLIAASSNDNCSVTFLGMEAGSYYIPVLADGIDTPVGPYTIEVTATACDAYCAASATDATFEVINNVNFAGINNASASTSGYEDHTAIVGQVVAGSSYPLTVVNTNGYATDMLMAWIDFNHSQTFEANELVYTSAAGVGPYTGNIAIPAGAALGQTRMRFRLQDTSYVNNFTPCGTHQYGQVQDYNVNITSGGSTPPNDDCTGAVNHALTVGQTLSLSGDNTGATDESGTGYQIVYEEFTTTTCANITVNYCVAGSVFTNFLTNLTTSCPDILTGLIAASSNDNCSVTFLGMAAGTYYVPVLADGIDTPNGPYTIEVTASACDVYCAASATDATYEVINHVTFAGIDNASATTAGYEDHSDIAGQVVIGNYYPLTVANDSGYATDMLMAWIDLDHSQTFEANELVYTSAAGVGPYTGSIGIPPGSAIGLTRMRLRLQDTAYVNNFTPCGTHQYGQVQDYSVDITIGTSVMEHAAGQIGVFPNPADGNFTVVLPEFSGSSTLDVLDVTGRLVHSIKAPGTSGNQIHLNLAGQLAQGSYLIRLTTDSARYEQWLMIH